MSEATKIAKVRLKGSKSDNKRNIKENWEDFDKILNHQGQLYIFEIIRT